MTGVRGGKYWGLGVRVWLYPGLPKLFSLEEAWGQSRSSAQMLFLDAIQCPLAPVSWTEVGYPRLRWMGQRQGTLLL